MTIRASIRENGAYGHRIGAFHAVVRAAASKGYERRRSIATPSTRTQPAATQSTTPTTA